MWTVSATKSDDTLRIRLDEVLHDSAHELGVDPGLREDGVEKHLQELLADHVLTLGEGLSLVRREFDDGDRPSRPAVPRGRRGQSPWRSSDGAISTASNS